jgi:phage terminase large subunit
VWFSWNPRRKSDAVDKLFRGEQLPDDTALVRCGYRVTVGAYFAQCLSKAREEGRIVANLTLDPLMQIKTAWDIGLPALSLPQNPQQSLVSRHIRSSSGNRSP